MTDQQYQSEISRLRPGLICIARRYLGEASLQAEDVVQEVCIRLWQMRANVSVPAGGLATVMVRNICIDTLRKQQRETEAYSEADLAPQSNAVLFDRVIESVGSLSPMLQTVFRMRHIDGKDTNEIAIAIGSNEAAVRKALSRARMAIREKLLKGGFNE